MAGTKYRSRRVGRRRVRPKYRSKKGSKRRAAPTRKRTYATKRDSRSRRRVNYTKRLPTPLVKRVQTLENSTGIHTNLIRWVDYESMILRHRLAATTDAAMVALGLFPFGIKDQGQKVLTLQKSLFGCARMIRAFDQAQGSTTIDQARTIAFHDMRSTSTILNQAKHAVNLRLTKLIARRPKKAVVVNSGGATITATATNPDLHVYYQIENQDHTDPDKTDRYKRFLYPDFKSAYSAPIAADWKAVKSMEVKLEPGKSIVIECKQRPFKCDRAYLSQHAWPKDHCTWLIEAWGEICHVGTQGANQQTLDPVANFNTTSQGADGLLIPGDVAVDVWTKYSCKVSFHQQTEKRVFHVNVPTTVANPALQQMGVDMYQEIADDN